MSSITTPDPATAAASAASDTSAAPPNPFSEAQEVSQSADPSVPDPATAVASTSTEAAPPLSKKAQKKLAKAAWLAERKKERRAVEKERRKEKKRAFAEKRAAGELDPEDEERERKRLKVDKGPRTPFAARVVVDLGFDEKMTENEVKSLSSQLAYTYSANKKAQHPFSSLLFTSLNGRTLTRMDATNHSAYKRWVGAEWWSEGYEQLWEGGEVGAPSSIEGAEGEIAEKSGRAAKRTKKQQPSRAARDTVIYLTADADDELTELKEGETYIIGGIVDHNRYKNLCLEKSKEHQVRSARLPIGTYLSELRTRKVLTVNQTFEILLNWVETRDWEQALYSVIPKRKFNDSGRRRGRGTSSKGGESGDEDGEGECDDDGDDGADEGADDDVGAKIIDVVVLEEDVQPESPVDHSGNNLKAMEVEEAAM
ncbi:hypothetical protein VTO73DRAFT_3282 [Trametes versicolor]